MRALVVYESGFGNTERVAQAVAAGLAEHAGEGMQVDLQRVDEAPAPLSDLVDLLVVGGPTHAFSMTREGTREDAVRQGARTTGTGIREWIDRLGDGPHSEMLATFDTRVDKVRRLPGSAAKAASRALGKHGYRQGFRPQSFYVADVAGPLLDGELDRARAWGRELAAAMSRTAGAS